MIHVTENHMKVLKYHGHNDFYVNPLQTYLKVQIKDLRLPWPNRVCASLIFDSFSWVHRHRTFLERQVVWKSVSFLFFCSFLRPSVSNLGRPRTKCARDHCAVPPYPYLGNFKWGQMFHNPFKLAFFGAHRKFEKPRLESRPNGL